jgi:hypothetical protein
MLLSNEAQPRRGRTINIDQRRSTSNRARHSSCAASWSSIELTEQTKLMQKLRVQLGIILVFRP